MFDLLIAAAALVFLVAPLVLAITALIQAQGAQAQARETERLVGRLQEELDDLRRQVDAGASPAPGAAVSVEPAPGRAADVPSGPPAPPPSVPLGPGSTRAKPRPAGVPYGRAAVAWLGRVFSNGANLAGLGAGLMLAGVAFFLEYGAQSGLLPRGTRLVAALVAGTGLVVAGFALRRRRPPIGLALQGGGLGVIYTALFAGHMLLHLLPAPATFVGLAALSVVAVALALVNDSRTLAFLSLVGGLAAPVLVMSSGGTLTALFGYYLLLNLGVLAVSVLRGWRSVHTAAFVLTFVTGGVLGGLRYSSEALLPAEPFLILFFLIYFVSALALAYRYPAKRLPLGHTATLPVMTLLLQAGILEDVRLGLAVSAAVLAVLYLGAAWALPRTKVPGWLALAAVFTPIGVGLFSAVFPLLLEPDLTGVLWSLQGASLMWVAVRYPQRWLRIFGLALLALSGLSVLAAGTWFGLLVWGGGVTAAAYTLRGERGEAAGLVLGGVALLLGAGLTAEEFLPARWAAGGALALGGFLLAGVYQVGRGGRWPAARRCAALLAGVAVAVFPVANGLERAPLFGLAAAGYAVLTLLLFLSQWDAEAWPGQRRFTALVLAWAPTVAVALSLYHLAEGQAWSRGFWPLAVMAPLGLLGLLAATPRWRSRVWRLDPVVFGRQLLAPVVAVLAAATLRVSFAGPLPGEGWHLPLLNPADLAVLFGVTVLALHWGSTPRSLEDWRLWGLVALGVLGITTAVARLASAHFGVPFAFGAALSSTGLQAAVSLLWSTLALVVLAFSRRYRSPLAWRIGLSLLALTTLKLLVVDLAGAGTVARIVSFVGVGALFVAVAFLMPAPKAGRGAADLP